MDKRYEEIVKYAESLVPADAYTDLRLSAGAGNIRGIIGRNEFNDNQLGALREAYESASNGEDAEFKNILRAIGCNFIIGKSGLAGRL